MILSDIEFYLAEIPCDPPFSAVRSVLVKLSTYSGKEGWGEAALPWRVSELEPRRESLLPVLTGRSVFDIEELLDLLAVRGVALCTAIETACWDLIGRLAGQPICRLLGGEYRHRVPIAIRLPADSPDRLGVLAKELAGKGFHWQMAVGEGNPERDAETVYALKEAVGQRVDLRFDARQAHDVEQAVTLCRLLEPLGLSFVLDPVKTRGDDENSRASDDFAACDSLAALVRQPLAVERLIASPHDAYAALRREFVSFMSIDLQRVAGILNAKKCATIAQAAGVRASLGGPPTLGVAEAARIQVAACSPAYSLGIASTHYCLRDDLLREPLAVADGFVAVPLGPGLGVDVDPAKLERYAVTG